MPDQRTEEVFRIVDAMDTAAFADLFSEDGSATFGNAEPMVGPAAIRAGIGGFFGTIAGLRHRVVRTWQVRADTVAETVVTYRRLDGGEVSVPAVTIWHTTPEDRIDDYRIYVDLAPLYAP
jgi:hypothetical protein